MGTSSSSPANRRRDPFADRLKKRRNSLSPRLLAVAEYIDGHRYAVLGQSALDIARETGTSDATVIRAIQMLGFDGLVDLKDTLGAYLGQTDSPAEKMAVTTRTLVGDINSALDFVLEDQANAMAALSSDSNRAAVARAVSILAQAKGIGVFGIGASGIIATYASRVFSRLGTPSYALDRTGIMLAEQLLQMRKGDALLMMLHGRPHREAMATIAEAERLSVPIVMIVGKSDTVIQTHAASVIVIPRAKSEHVALHAPTLLCAEALMLGVAGQKSEQALAAIDRLLVIREQIRPNRR